MSTYILNPSLQVLLTSAEEIVFRGGQFDTFSVVVSTTDMPLGASELVDLLRSGVTVDQLVEECFRGAAQNDGDVEKRRDQYSENLARLVDIGVVRRVPVGAKAEMWGAFRRFGRLEQDWAAETSFVVVGSNSLAGRLSDLMTAAGARLERCAFADGIPSEGDPITMIAVAEGESVVDVHAFNKASVNADRKVLWVQASGRLALVGPFVRPGRTPCYWEWERAFARSIFEQELFRAGRRPSVPVWSAPEATRQMALTMVVPALVELVAFDDMAEPSDVLVADAALPSVIRETCLRLPRCPVCSPKRPAVRSMFP